MRRTFSRIARRPFRAAISRNGTVLAVVTKFGCEKIGLVLHLASNPGDAPEGVATAIDALGMSWVAINVKGKKQFRYSRKALEDAVGRHAHARSGTTTELRERPGGNFHGPTSYVRIETRVLADGSTQPAEQRFAPVITILWAFDQATAAPGRKDFDRVLRMLTRCVSVRAGSAGLVWASIERPMMKHARAVADDMLAAMLARPHAHSNHRALLDTTSAALEPAFWMFLGPNHLERLGKREVAATFRTDFGSGGASFALFDEPPIEATRRVVEAHVSLARSLGPLYPPVAISEILNCVSVPMTAGFGLSRWLARYQDPELMRRLTADLTE